MSEETKAPHLYGSHRLSSSQFRVEMGTAENKEHTALIPRGLGRPRRRDRPGYDIAPGRILANINFRHEEVARSTRSASGDLGGPPGGGPFLRGEASPGLSVWAGLARQKGRAGFLLLFMIFRRGADKGAAESANVASAACVGEADWAEPGLGGQNHACPCRGGSVVCQLSWMSG